MDKQQNAEPRPGDVERPQKSGAASPGRGGRMSRQRKTAAVLTIVTRRGPTVSRGLGVTAASLSGWSDAFLATGEELSSDRLKAKLGAALIERDLLHETIAILAAHPALARQTFRRDGFAGDRQPYGLAAVCRAWASRAPVFIATGRLRPRHRRDGVGPPARCRMRR